MSHSTHIGLNAPPAFIASVSLLRFNSDGLFPLSLCIREVGVGNILTASLIVI
jgi:hypothetical protein